MLDRLYINNFRSLVNLDLRFGELTLLLGPNGSGKTAAFEVLRCLRDFVCGESTTTELFPSSTLTRWQQQNVQTFEVGLSSKHGSYAYHLELEHDVQRQKCRVQQERLTLDGHTLYESRMDAGQLRARLYRDNFAPGPEVLVDWTRSALATIQPADDNRLLTQFRERMSRMLITRPNPVIMETRTEEESTTLSWNACNFVSWFRHMAAIDLEFVARLRPLLNDVLPGLEGLSLVPDGAEAKLLKVKFKAAQGDSARSSIFECRFDELSDGQRVLLVLYAILVAADVLAAEEQWTICLDEPENFVALREINPWLNMLIDRSHGGPCQAVLISHHPEFINALAAGSGLWLDRVCGGATRAQVVTDDGSGLSPAELVAKGWLGND